MRTADRRPVRFALGILAGFIALLVVARICLPYVVKSQLNAKLAGLPSRYTGEVQDVSLALWRGDISLHGLQLREEGEFFKLNLPKLDINLEWGPLLRRRIFVASVTALRPSLRMKVAPAVKAAKKAEAAVSEKAKELKAEQGERQDSRPIPALLEEISPFRIDRIDIKDGEVIMREEGDQAEARFFEIQAVIENLTNAAKWSSGPTAKAKASARVQETGSLRIEVQLNPTARQPNFRLTLAVEKLLLKEVNPLLRSEYGVDVESGTFDLYAEAEAKEGGFKGYVKPFIDGLEMHGKKDKGALKVIKEAVVGAVAAVLKNKDTESVATKVPFEGRFDDPQVGVWAAVVSVLRHAFLKALGPSFDGL